MKRRAASPHDSPANSGSALVLVLLITALLTTIVVSFLSTSRIEQTAARNFTQQNAATGLAETATQLAMDKIQQGFTVNGTDTTVITTQPGAIRQFVFSGGNITSNSTMELFSGTGGVTTNGSVNLNNLENPAASTSNATSAQWTITGNAGEQIEVPMEEIEDSNGDLIGRIAYYVDDEGTKLNVNNATGNRTTLNAAVRPQDIAALVNSAAGNFSSIVNNLTANTGNITGWNHFFRPEQVPAAVNDISGNDTPFISTATSAANSTANMTHLLTPWGTKRLYINELSTNATDGTGDASVKSIFEAFTGLSYTYTINEANMTTTYNNSNSTYGLTGQGLQNIFGGNFSTKYTNIGVKQIAANMLQMRDPNTATVNASFNYKGPLIGSRSLNDFSTTPKEASAAIPQEYLGYAPYPVISEVSADVNYINRKPFIQPYIQVNVELYNPYPVAFNAPNATLEYCIRGLTWNMTHSIISTGATFGPFRYGGYGDWTDSITDPEWASNANLRNDDNPNTQFAEDNRTLWVNPYGIRGITIPAFSKMKYTMAFLGNWGGGVTVTNTVFPFDSADIRIDSITDVRCTITYIKITADSTIGNRLGGATNINPTTVRDWVIGAEVGPFIPNGGSLSVAGGGAPGASDYLDQGVYRWPPAGTATSFPRNAGKDDYITPCNLISAYSYQRLCPLIKTSIAASADLTDSTRSWTPTAIIANQTFGNRNFSSAPATTANQTELLNDANANPLFDAGNTIPSDPSYNNNNGNAIFANATLTNGTLTNGPSPNDMRIAELPNFAGTYIYTSPSDLGLVPTNQRWRRLRMQMQPSAEDSLIPDWAMLDVISFGNSTDTDNPLSRIPPVNINGKFYLPAGNAAVAPRTIGLKALTQVLESVNANKIQGTMTAATPTSMNATRFRGNTGNATAIANAIGNMTWSSNSTWGNATTGKRWKINNNPIDNYILPSEIMEIAGVADAVDQTDYANSTSHFKWNEGRASAILPAVTTRSSFFSIYAYAQALDKQGNIDSEALTKTIVEVEHNAGNYTVKKLYTQPIPLAQ